MKLKYLASLSVFMVGIFFFSTSFAETIYMKDGRVIKEKITERHDHYIITMTGRFPHRYYRAQIDYILEDPVDITEKWKNIKLTPYGDIPEERIRLIIAFIDASGVRRNMEKNIGDVISRTPEEK